MSKRHCTALMLLCWFMFAVLSLSMIVGLASPEHNIVRSYAMCLCAAMSQAYCALYWTKARHR